MSRARSPSWKQCGAFLRAFDSLHRADDVVPQVLASHFRRFKPILTIEATMAFLTGRVTKDLIRKARKYGFTRHNLTCNDARGGRTSRKAGATWIVNEQQKTVFWGQPRIPADHLIDHIVRCYRAIEAPRISWGVSSPYPSDLRARLASRGFEMTPNVNTAMWLDTRTVDLEACRVKDAALRMVSKPSEPEVDGLPFYHAELVRANRLAMDRWPSEFFYCEAYDDTGIVGHAHVRIHPGRFGIGTLHDVGVTRSARGRGIGKAVTAAVCRAAQKAGVRYISTNASDEGYHLYSRLDFVSVGPNTSMVLWSRLLQTPPTKRQREVALAIGRGHLSTLRRLLNRRGSSLDLPNGMSPLLLATQIARSDRMVRYLIEAGSPIDGDEKHYGGPLLAAAGAGLTESVDALLLAGANPSVQDSTGRTPVELAAAGGHSRIVELLEG